MAEIPVAVREALDLAFSMTADAEKPINAGGIDPDLWQGLALEAVAAALAAAKEEGRREEREACAKECEAVVANEIKDECIGEYDAWASCCVSRIRARSVKP